MNLRNNVVMNNPKVRKMLFAINGTAGTPAASGLDSSQILSVTDNGTGDYTIVFKNPFHPNANVQGMVSSKTAGVQALVTAIDFDRVTVEGVDTTDGSTAADCDFDIEVSGLDGRIKY